MREQWRWKSSTSLNRGERLTAGWSGNVGGVKGESGGREVVVEAERAKINHDGLICNQNSARPIKIAVDIDACGSDIKLTKGFLL